MFPIQLTVNIVDLMHYKKYDCFLVWLLLICVCCLSLFNLTQISFFFFFLYSPHLQKKMENALLNSYQTFYINFYSRGLMQVFTFITYRMNVVSVSVYIYRQSACLIWLYACIYTGWMWLNAYHSYLCKLDELIALFTNLQNEINVWPTLKSGEKIKWKICKNMFLWVF